MKKIINKIINLLINISDLIERNTIVPINLELRDN
jgi:hypothetical protein